MVACDHNRTDACLAADLHGLLCRRARRVDHADQTGEGQPAFQLLHIGLFGYGFDLLIGHSDDAQRVSAHLVVDLRGGIKAALHTARRDAVERTLDDDHVFTAHAVDGGHALAVRVKRQLSQPRVLFCHCILPQPVFVRGDDDRGLGLVADVLFRSVFKGDRAVAAQHAEQQQLLDRRGVLAADFLGRVLSVCPRLDQRHAVLGKRAGLIRADDRCAAQRFNRRQTADDRILFDHALHADREHDGDDRGQALRNGGYRERYRSHEDLEHWDAVQHADHENDRAGSQRENA